MQIITLKLVTGEEIVAELVSTSILAEKATSYTIRRPHMIHVQPLPDRKYGLALSPWSMSNPELDTLEIPISAVLAKFAPSGKTEAQYLQQTSSIQLAPAGSI